MDWITVIALIGVGIALVVVEIVIVPGTTVVGFMGFGLAITGVVLAFQYFGETIGWIFVASSSVLMGLLFIWSLRAKPWEVFSLKSSISSKVNEGLLDNLIVGQEGIAVSALRPMGKVDFNGTLFEVATLGNFVDSGVRVKIVNLTSNQIIVEPLT